jgi:hypothetical protein
MESKKALFFDELCDLLEKYNVDISAEDHWESYAECGKDLRITFDFMELAETSYIKHVDVDSLVKEIAFLNGEQ